jgi:hypothetical protein
MIIREKLTLEYEPRRRGIIRRRWKHMALVILCSGIVSLCVLQWQASRAARQRAAEARAQVFKQRMNQVPSPSGK